MNASLRNQVSGILPLRAPLRCAHRRHAPRALFISKASVVRLVVLVVGSDGAGQPVVIVVDASIIATIVPHAGAMVVRAAAPLISIVGSHVFSVLLVGHHPVAIVRPPEHAEDLGTIVVRGL